MSERPCPHCGQPMPGRWTVKVFGQPIADFATKEVAKYYGDGLRLEGQKGVTVHVESIPDLQEVSR